MAPFLKRLNTLILVLVGAFAVAVMAYLVNAREL